MASIRKYATSTGTAWRVQYRSPDGRSRTKQGFRTKAEAQAWADKNAVAIREQGWINPQHGKTTINELGAVWITTRTHLKPSTYRVVEQHWRVHVQPHWGHMQVRSIQHTAIQTWTSQLAQHRSATVVRGAHNCLAQILDLAVKDGLIKANPARDIRLPRKQKAVRVYLTVEQLGVLARASSKHRELIWLLGTSGLRFGEAAALRPMDLDVGRRRIHITRNAVTVGGDCVIGTPKTHERRTVAVAGRVMGLLAGLSVGKKKEELLWARADGTPLRVPGRGSWFDWAVKRAQGRESDFPRLTPHGLRHVAAGLLVQSGANVKVVQRQLGHASAAMTLDTYADLFDDGLDSIAETLDEIVSPHVVELSWD